MVTRFRANKLLHEAANIQEGMQQKFNKVEISKKIDEIKYLSTQKNVPRLSLRKEIVHLERKLEHIFAMEQKLIDNDKKESIKVNSLKNQINNLKNRLNSTEDKELKLKVNKLYHILTELLAKSELKKDVAFSNKLLDELKHVDHAESINDGFSKKKNVIKKVDSKKEAIKDKRAALLLHRIKSLKHELELKVELSTTNPSKIAEIKKQIAGLEVKIQQIQNKSFDTNLVEQTIQAPNHTAQMRKNLNSDKLGGDSDRDASSQIKHTMMMGENVVNSINPIENNMQSKNQMSIKNANQTTNMPGQQISNLENKLQTGTLSQKEEVAIKDEVIAELPLPAPPRIRKK